MIQLGSVRRRVAENNRQSDNRDLRAYPIAVSVLVGPRIFTALNLDRGPQSRGDLDLNLS